MAYQFDDSEKFRANMFLLFGLGLISPSGVAINEYISNGNMPSVIDFVLLSLLFIVGGLSITYGYSIIYIKDFRNAAKYTK